MLGQPNGVGDGRAVIFPTGAGTECGQHLAGIRPHVAHRPQPFPFVESNAFRVRRGMSGAGGGDPFGRGVIVTSCER